MKMTVYHGSNAIIREPKIIIGRNTKDFGPGFYCTVIREQAERWAMRFPSPVVNEYFFLPDNDLKILEFKEMTDAWLDFIADCRAGKAHGNDIVIGAMANDQIYNYVSDFIDGTITREQFWILAKFKYPTHQICFCSDNALKCLKFNKAEEVQK